MLELRLKGRARELELVISLYKLSCIRVGEQRGDHIIRLQLEFQLLILGKAIGLLFVDGHVGEADRPAIGGMPFGRKEWLLRLIFGADIQDHILRQSIGLEGKGIGGRHR